MRVVFPLGFAAALVPIEEIAVQAFDDLGEYELAERDATRAEWFEKLTAPSGRPCCSIADCRRTTAAWRDDTQGWWAIVNGQWLPIPADKVLESPRSIDGDAYVCTGEGSQGEPQDIPGSESARVPSLPGVIHCFIPPDLGS